MIIDPANRLEHINEYYFSSKLKEIARLRAEGKNIINLGIGNPDQAPSAQTVEALKNAADNPRNHGYQSYIGIPPLRDAFSEWYRITYDADLDPNSEILPLLGSKEGISHISNAFLNPGDKVLIPNPGYPTYTAAAYLAGAQPVYYDLDEANHWIPMLEQIPAATLREVKLLWINYPNMPTGSTGTARMFERLIEIAAEFKFLVVNDNPYSLVLNTEKPVSIFQYAHAKTVCLELNSLSKSHNLAGARIGMLGGAKDYIDTVLRVKSNVDSGMYLPLQEAAVAALSNSEEWHEQRNEVYKERRNFAWNILDQLECSYEKEQVGMFVWAKIPDRYKRSDELTEKLLQEAGVFMTPGFIFGSNGDRYVRISLCSPKNDLEEALLRIQRINLKEA
jgi:aspartate/methionine/tyrosine aminotransferase